MPLVRLYHIENWIPNKCYASHDHYYRWWLYQLHQELPMIYSIDRDHICTRSNSMKLSATPNSPLLRIKLLRQHSADSMSERFCYQTITNLIAPHSDRALIGPHSACWWLVSFTADYASKYLSWYFLCSRVWFNKQRWACVKLVWMFPMNRHEMWWFTVWMRIRAVSC